MEREKERKLEMETGIGIGRIGNDRIPFVRFKSFLERAHLISSLFRASRIYII